MGIPLRVALTNQEPELQELTETFFNSNHALIPPMAHPKVAEATIVVAHTMMET